MNFANLENATDEEVHEMTEYCYNRIKSELEWLSWAYIRGCILSSDRIKDLQEMLEVIKCSLITASCYELKRNKDKK